MHSRLKINAQHAVRPYYNIAANADIIRNVAVGVFDLTIPPIIPNMVFGSFKRSLGKALAEAVGFALPCGETNVCANEDG